MRFSVLFLFSFFALGSLSIFAQDAATMANTQAVQDAQQAAQLATQAAEQANRDAMQASQQATQQANINSLNGNYPVTTAPRLSMKAGTYSAPIQIRLKDKTRGAVIYYTTDGWTPTTASTRYIGPITISSTTTFQAVAVAPNCSRSLVTTAVYTLPAAANQASPSMTVSVLPSGKSDTSELVLPKGLEVPLVFTSPVSSKTAEVGDLVSLELAEDIKAGDQVLVAKGTPAVGRVIQVDRPGMAGQPGDLTFEVESLKLKGTVVELAGERTKEGQNKIKKVSSLTLIPFAGFSALMLHGEEAEIDKGASVVAQVAKDTAVKQ